MTSTAVFHLTVAAGSLLILGGYWVLVKVSPYKKCECRASKGKRRRTCRKCKDTGMRPRFGVRLITTKENSK